VPAGVHGDFAAANRLVVGLGRIAQRGQLEALAQEMGATALDEVLTCFERSVDPYDRPWQQLRYRNGQILVDTARLRNSLHAIHEGRTFGVGTDVVYAATHNYGDPRRNIPRRMFVPDGEHLGWRFRAALEATARAHMARFVD
jgi:phage gpG-like protein